MESSKIPPVSIDDLKSFHTQHFSANGFDSSSIPLFLGNPATDNTTAAALDNEYDDDLGYYDDGVKRTLTSEQIEIFRHSEIQNLIRERRLECSSSEQRSGEEDSNMQDASVHPTADGDGNGEKQASSKEISHHTHENGPRKRIKTNNNVESITNGSEKGGLDSSPTTFQGSKENAAPSRLLVNKVAVQSSNEYRRRLVSYEDA